MTYAIKKGHHYSKHWPKIHLGKTNLRIRFKFLDGTWFPIDIPDDSAINKLVGFGYGLSHHQNSVRVGWTPNKEPGHIDLFFYLYSNGQRTDKYFATVEIGKAYEMEIDIFNGLVSFNLMFGYECICLESLPYKLPKFRWGFWLFPFVGGQLPARTYTAIDLEIV